MQDKVAPLVVIGRYGLLDENSVTGEMKNKKGMKWAKKICSEKYALRNSWSTLECKEDSILL